MVMPGANQVLSVQARLDKEDLRIEMSVATLHRQTKKAVRQAADLEVTLGEHAAYVGNLCHFSSSTSSKSPRMALLSECLAFHIRMRRTPLSSVATQGAKPFQLNPGSCSSAKFT